MTFDEEKKVAPKSIVTVFAISVSCCLGGGNEAMGPCAQVLKAEEGTSWWSCTCCVLCEALSEMRQFACWRNMKRSC